jgi:hypothetical protein
MITGIEKKIFSSHPVTSKQPHKIVQIHMRHPVVLETSKSAGAKGDFPKICGFVHPLHPH